MQNSNVSFDQLVSYLVFMISSFIIYKKKQNTGTGMLSIYKYLNISYRSVMEQSTSVGILEAFGQNKMLLIPTFLGPR